MVTHARHSSRISLLLTAVAVAILLALSLVAPATAASNGKITVRSLTVVGQSATRATIKVRNVPATTKCDVNISNRKTRSTAGTNGFEIRVQLRKNRKTTTQRGTITCKPQNTKRLRKSFRLRVRGAKTGTVKPIRKISSKRTNKKTATSTKTPTTNKTYDPTNATPPKHFTLDQKIVHGQQYFRNVIAEHMKVINDGQTGYMFMIVMARNLDRVDHLVASVVRNGRIASQVNFQSHANAARVINESGLPTGRPYEVGQWLFEPNNTSGPGGTGVFGEITSISPDGKTITVFGSCDDQGISTGCEQVTSPGWLEARGVKTVG